MKRIGFVIVAASFAFTLALASCNAIADDDPQSTVVRWCSGPWTLGCETDYQQATIVPADSVQGATGISFDKAVFRWLFHVSGPEACIFTANKGNDGKLIDIGGGRDCNANVSNCGFIVRGYNVYGVSGKACNGYGVEPCTGWCN